MRLLVLLGLVLLALGASASATGAQDPNPLPPTATTGAADNLGQVAVTLTGSVDPRGTLTTYQFEYGTTTAYGLVTADRTAGPAAGSVAAAIAVSGLTPATTYHYRLVATNAAGVTRGADRTFTTANPPSGPRPPSVSTGGARSVQPTTATLTGSLTPRGQATTSRFEYGTSTRYGSTTPATAAGAGTRGVSVSAAISALRANTRYHYRLVATNASGVTRGRDRTFTTLRGPSGISASATPDPAPWGTRVTVTGRLAGTGVGGATVAVERQNFPFAQGFSAVGSQRASSSGAFRFSVGPLWETTRLRVVSRTTIPVASPTIEVGSRVRVGLRRAVSTRRRVSFTGAISPAVPPAARVSVQRQTRTGRWLRVRRARFAPLSGNRTRYATTVGRLRRTVRYRVVVLPRDGGAHARGESRELPVRGRR